MIYYFAINYTIRTIEESSYYVTSYNGMYTFCFDSKLNRYELWDEKSFDWLTIK